MMQSYNVLSGEYQGALEVIVCFLNLKSIPNNLKSWKSHLTNHKRITGYSSSCNLAKRSHHWLCLSKCCKTCTLLKPTVSYDSYLRKIGYCKISNKYQRNLKRATIRTRDHWNTRDKFPLACLKKLHIGYRQCVQERRCLLSMCGRPWFDPWHCKLLLQALPKVICKNWPWELPVVISNQNTKTKNKYKNVTSTTWIYITLRAQWENDFL